MSSKHDFLIALKYQNDIPSAPCGPYLKNVGMYHDFETCVEYRTSTLEKGYVWQPHFGPDLGISLDLVDQDLLLSQDKEVQKLDQSDIRYLSSIAEKGRGKARQLDQSSKPWWLRNTTYMENNIFNQIPKARVDGLDAAQRRSKIRNKKDPFSKEGIVESFELVRDTVEDIRRKGKVKRVMEVLPLAPWIDGSPIDPISFLGKKHSLVRFDEDPQLLSNKTASLPTKAKEEPDENDGKKVKRMRIDRGIITNLRQPDKAVEFKKALLPEVSLVAPLADDEPSNDKEAEDSQVESAKTNKESAGKEDTPDQDDSLEGTLYDWVIDYRMEVLGSDVKDSFVFLMNNELNGEFSSADDTSSSSDRGNGSSSTGDASEDQHTVHFFPLRARIDLRKIPYEDAKPHECYVLPQE